MLESKETASDVGVNDVDCRKVLSTDEGSLVDTALNALKDGAGKLTDKLDP
jgi:hypothetical protein